MHHSTSTLSPGTELTILHAFHRFEIADLTAFGVHLEHHLVSIPVKLSLNNDVKLIVEITQSNTAREKLRVNEIHTLSEYC